MRNFNALKTGGLLGALLKDAAKNAVADVTELMPQDAKLQDDYNKTSVYGERRATSAMPCALATCRRATSSAAGSTSIGNSASSKLTSRGAFMPPPVHVYPHGWRAYAPPSWALTL